MFLVIVSSNSTKATIRIEDYSGSPIWSVSLLFRVRILACDNTFTSNNIKIQYKEFVVEPGLAKT